MHTLSYTLSPVLQKSLKDIEVKRESIILFPLSLASELQLQWDATIQRIYYSLHLAHNPVSQQEIARALSSPTRRAMLPAETDIVNYKRGLDIIKRDWFMSEKPIMPQVVQSLYKLVANDKTRLPENELMEMLVFLQTSREHPFVQAFVSYIQFSLIVPNSDASGKLARLLPYLFLAKNGLDFRGLLVIEEYFYKNERLMRELLIAADKRESVSVWIEHFIDSIANQLEHINKNLAQSQNSSTNNKNGNLTERQKEILTDFDHPGARITNKKVQERYGISQITASRDLSKLATLGLLFQYGKGRSVYYTRA